MNPETNTPAASAAAGTVRALDAIPSMAPLMGKALLGATPLGAKKGGKELPDLCLQVDECKIDGERLSQYCRVTGFTVRDAIPSIYPNVLAFPMHMALMTDSKFPFPVMGMVHVENRIRQFRPIQSGEALSLRVFAEGLRPHTRGRQFDVVTETYVDGELANRAESTYLRRGGPKDRAAEAAERAAAAERRAPETLPVIATWKIPGDQGRQYAAVSGDRNPIHLYDVTAKAFGFPRAIAHGMWTKARCIAALDGRIPEAHQVRVSFRKPVLLPAKVEFRAEQEGEGIDFAATNAKKGSVHLEGRLEAL